MHFRARGKGEKRILYQVREKADVTIGTPSEIAGLPELMIGA
jgi:hypothetical protein